LEGDRRAAFISPSLNRPKFDLFAALKQELADFRRKKGARINAD